MKISADTKIGEIVRKNYNTAMLFDEHNIDFCCGGEKTLEKACQDAKVELETIKPDLASLVTIDDPESSYIERLPLDKLCTYIVERHHNYINEKIPFLRKKLKKLMDAHGEKHPELNEVRGQFEEAAGNLSVHMKKEELILFPYIQKMVRFQQEGIDQPEEFNGIDNLITVMLQEHQNEGDRFHQINQLTNNYQVPADGCTTYNIAFRILHEFEKDLHKHIHLENNVLFQKAINLEQQLTSQ